MRNELPKYPMYRTSGAECPKEIPDSWEVRRLRFLLAQQLSNGLFKKGEFWGEGTRIVNVIDVYPDGDVVREENLDRVLCSDEERETYSAENGDIFFVRSSLKLEGLGKPALVDHPSEPLVFECHLIRCRPRLKEIDARFLNVFLNSKESRDLLVSAAKTVTMATVDQIRFKDLPVFFPPIDDQRGIVAFLDVETGKIDRLMGVRRRQMEVLREQRAAVIHHAVTQGLDPTAPMKDSGIEWLGKIPERWEVKPIKRYLIGIRDGTHGTHERFADGVPLLSAKNVQNGKVTISEIESFVSKDEHNLIVSNGYPRRGDVLITIVGTIGRSAVFHFDEPIAFQRSVAFLRFKKKVSPEYMIYFIRSEPFQHQLSQSTKTSAQGGVYMGALAELYCNFPALEEQAAIVVHIDRETGKIDALIGKYERELALLEEYRASLISHAVTGKVDVRGLVESNGAKEGATA